MAEGKRPRWGRRILFGVFFTFLGVNVILAGILLYLTSSVPDLTDSVDELAGLTAPVTVERDETGVVWIKAETAEDANFALGYTHAQDRLFQMEMNRRIGAGRLHEAIGDAGLGFDKMLRTLGIYRLAEQNYDLLSVEAKAHLDAYTAGVNAYLENRSGALPPELVILRIDPEPWKPGDSLVWGRLMAMQLSGNWFAEVTRAQMLKAGLTPDDISLLYAPFPGEARSTLSPELAALQDAISEKMLSAIADAAHPAIQPRYASNAWALDGTRTPTGKPILAGDPHLGLKTPNLWHLARVEAPGFTRVGAFVLRSTVPPNRA